MSDTTKKLDTMSDSELEDYLVSAIRGSTVLISRGHPYGSFGDKIDAGYDEAKQRGRLEIYDRAYERTKKSFGL